MGVLRDSYGNTKLTGFTINWFSDCTLNPRNAFLASPFFTFSKPVEDLAKASCSVNLIVRLCSITTPSALRAAMAHPLVRVRYYTDRHFHAKLYIVDDVALVGSANLTESGMMTNREVSVVLKKERDAGFDDLPSLFDLFWSSAETLTPEILSQYEQAYRIIGKPSEEADFQRTLENFVPKAEVPSAKVGSEKVSAQRNFLRRYQRKYDEQLIPAFREVATTFAELGQRRPEFEGSDPEIEIGRFLGWVRLVNAPGDEWQKSSFCGPADRRIRIEQNIKEWVASGDTKAGDMYNADTELSRIARLREAMASEESIQALSYDDLFNALISVHAFNDRLRHVSGGREGLKVQFRENNSLDRVKATLTYLLHGNRIALERAYDCIQSEQWKLSGFGEACVMELLGWMDPERPPINGRTVKALRFFGFDVHE